MFDLLPSEYQSFLFQNVLVRLVLRQIIWPIRLWPSEDFELCDRKLKNYQLDCFFLIIIYHIRYSVSSHDQKWCLHSIYIRSGISVAVEKINDHMDTQGGSDNCSVWVHLKGTIASPVNMCPSSGLYLVDPLTSHVTHFSTPKSQLSEFVTLCKNYSGTIVGCSYQNKVRD